MKSGYMWFDDAPGRTLPDKVERMVVYYRHKTGLEFDICYIHPDTPGLAAFISPDGETPRLAASASGVEIRTSKTVLPNHFWIGRRDE